MISKHTALAIEEVGNGFIVYPSPITLRRDDCIYPTADTQVFQTVPALLAFLREHFAKEKS